MGGENKLRKKAAVGKKVILVLLMAALLCTLYGCGGSNVSEDVVSQAALELAEQDYGYKLEMKSYDIVDKFKVDEKVELTGAEIKGTMYLVILDAEAKDEDGNVVETLKYGVSVLNPEKSGENVEYSAFSVAGNCTGMEDSEIKELLESIK